MSAGFRGGPAKAATIVAADLGLELQFLESVFGAQIVERVSDPAGALESASVLIDGNLIQVRRGEQASKEHDFGLAVRVLNLEEVCQKAVGSGASKVRAPGKRGKADGEVTIVDPSGVTWRLLESHRNPSTREVKRRLMAQRRSRL